MEIKVLGCHGGETPRHRTSSFILDGRVAIDAGAITSGLTLAEQKSLTGVLVSHAHMDHVRDLATLADNRCQMADKTLLVAGSPGTIRALKKHFFNNILWPDFARIPLTAGKGPTIEYQVIRAEKPTDVLGYRVRTVMVSHTIESAAFVIENARGALAYSGDTGPTERFWKVLSGVENLRALMMEVSFPNGMAWLARNSGHHTPETMAKDIGKIAGAHNPSTLPILAYHIKPHFQREVERELAKIKKRDLDVLSIGDELIV